MAQAGCFDALCTEVVTLVREGDPEAKRRIEELRKKEAELDRVCKKLGQAVERASDIEELLARLRAREAERREIRLEIERLGERNQAKPPLPTAEDIRRTLDDLKDRLLGDFGPDVGPLLRRLIDGQILAVPYRSFCVDTLRLRAHLTVNLLRLLPEQWQRLLADRTAPEDLARLVELQATSLAVDLFVPPSRVRHAQAVYKLVSGGLTIADAARRLDLPETTANRAYRTGKAMAELGLEDAYTEVKSMPDDRPAEVVEDPGPTCST
jgi:hypothetical protein